MEQNKRSRVSAVNIVFLISVLISVTVAFLPLDFMVGRPALQIVFSQVILVVPSVVYMLKYRLPYAETVRFKRMKFADMALCVLFGILIQPLLTLLNAVSMVFSTNTTSEFMLELSGTVPFFGALFLMAIVPAVLEETVYRGVFYNEYSKLSPWKAVLLSGFLFGLMHGNINQFCYAAVMGWLFALLINATGSILSTMLVHFWINAGSVVMIYLYPKLYEVMQVFYRMYKEYGNEEMAEMLEISFGDMTMSSDEWMEQVIHASSELLTSLPAVIAMYAPQAVIMGILAFFVYRKLAQRNGNWEAICAMFGRKKEIAEGAGGEAAICSGGVQQKQRMVTVPLVIAIIIGVAFMVFVEIVTRAA